MDVQRLLVRIDPFEGNHVNYVDDQDKDRDWNQREEHFVIEQENCHSHHNQVQEVGLSVLEFFWFLENLAPRVLTQENISAVVETDHRDEESSHNANESSEVEEDASGEDFDIFVADQDLQEQSSQHLQYRPYYDVSHQVVRSMTDFE